MFYVFLSRDVTSFAKMIIWMFTTCSASVESCPAPPSNITLVLTGWSPPAVLVRWRYDCPVGLQHFVLTCRASVARYRIIQEVDPNTRTVTLDHLRPGVEYQLHLTAISTTGSNISSPVISFVAPDVQNESTREKESYVEVNNFLVREEEVVIVVIVLIVWVAVIILFFNKWGKIRMLEPYQPAYRSQTLSAVLQKQQRVPDLNPPEKTLQRFTSFPTYSNHRFRPRQNSVFVTSPSNSNPIMHQIGMPRKVKSAEDIQSLVVQINCNDIQSTAL
ncbi:fibronectin type III domain-containing protein 5-like [Centruroides vittatus]|uniref:fibronectin type III domain-containing protein 5-like n=1 Tax=Centruroides vittatus TaxID=120091 RepID=UPI00350F7089